MNSLALVFKTILLKALDGGFSYCNDAPISYESGQYTFSASKSF